MDFPRMTFFFGSRSLTDNHPWKKNFGFSDSKPYFCRLWWRFLKKCLQISITGTIQIPFKKKVYKDPLFWNVMIDPGRHCHWGGGTSQVKTIQLSIAHPVAMPWALRSIIQRVDNPSRILQGIGGMAKLGTNMKKHHGNYNKTRTDKNNKSKATATATTATTTAAAATTTTTATRTTMRRRAITHMDSNLSPQISWGPRILSPVAGSSVCFCFRAHEGRGLNIAQQKHLSPYPPRV